MRISWIMVAALAVAALAGCGGKDKTEPREPNAFDREPEPNTPNDAVADPEKLDAIQSVFKRKTPRVSQCYTDAVQAGTIPAEARGQIHLIVQIAADGSVASAKVSASSLKSAPVEECVLDQVKTWDFPAPGAPTSFSYSYGFEP